MKNKTQSQIKVLGIIYMATDCSNEVYDWATLHHTQRKIAEKMPDLVCWIDGCVPVDGDGFARDTYVEGRGYRLTREGYEALTASNPDCYPESLRRFGTMKGIPQ